MVGVLKISSNAFEKKKRKKLLVFRRKKMLNYGCLTLLARKLHSFIGSVVINYIILEKLILLQNTT